MNATTVTNSFKKTQELFRMMTILQLTSYMWPQSVQVKDCAVYDFIIVGGGTAGCVIASRLAELSNVRVLLIEAGGYPPVESKYPAYFPYLKHSQSDYNFTSVQEDTMQYHKGGVADITQGHVLGGSSSVNYMDYGRGYPDDYDKWARITNDSSWSYRAIFPLFIKSEKIIDKKILRSPEDQALHGTQGNLKLIKYYYSVAKKYLKAFEEIGTKVVLDINNRNPLGISHVLFTNSKNERHSTARSFLSHLKNNCNLDVMLNAMVIKIVFDENKTAREVKVRTKNNKIITVKANKEIIIAAGVFKTVQLLMLSGIGPKEHLISQKIQVIADLPVGKNLQDHPICVSTFKMGKRQSPVGPVNPHKFVIPALDGYFALKSPQNFPDYQVISLIVDKPEDFIIICAISFSFTNELCDSILRDLGDKQIYMVFNILSYPKSRGEILLNTSKIEDQPIIKLGYYINNKDLQMHAKSVMHFNGILNSTFFKEVSAEVIDPKLKECGNLEKESEKYWECYCSKMVTTGNYFAGTCAMGAVLDSKLMVKDVKALRVANACVMPINVASPSVAAVIMIAQKAANMIVEKHSLK